MHLTVFIELLELTKVDIMFCFTAGYRGYPRESAKNKDSNEVRNGRSLQVLGELISLQSHGQA